MLDKNISTLPTLKFDPLENPFIKYGIFEGNISFPSIRTSIGIVIQ